MSKYLDPRADVVFKKIFGDHPKLLMSFLNAVLPLPSHRPIESLSYLQYEQIPSIPAFKHTIVDVKCKDSTGRVFIVEMQMSWTDHFKERLLFGASQAFVKQLEKGEHYKLLEPVYGLGLVGTIFEKDDTEWYHHYKLVRKGASHKEDIIQHLQLIFIELGKFPVQSPEHKQLRLLWLRFMREINEHTTKVSEELLEVPEIAEAVALAEEAAYSSGELNLYESYWKHVSSEKTLVEDNYLKGEAKGREEGIVEGMVKGREEGIVEGMAKGREEGMKNMLKAIELLKLGHTLEDIEKQTGLKRSLLEKLC